MTLHPQQNIRGYHQNYMTTSTILGSLYYTPGREKIVPRNPNNQTSQHAGKVYRDSDYTVVIAIMP